MDLSLLNPTQKEAVTFRIHPLMVIAGAGSGKTLVLTYRVAYLIKKGFKPSKLFITTFTVKAADEMTERLKLLIGENKANRLRIGTFHSLCYRMYRDLLDMTGYIDDYPKVLRGGSRFMTMVSIVNKYKIDSSRNKLHVKNIKLLLAKISYFKNLGITVEQFKETYQSDFQIKHENTYDEKYSQELSDYLIYKDYEDTLKQRNMIDFDDMLLKTYVMLTDPHNKNIADNIRSSISHILVDEAQDLNIIQHKLIDVLSGGNKAVTLVLDDWQAIYRFRNVEIQSIFDFKDKYQAEIIKLEQNYRSTKHIVESGNRLIENNVFQIEKKLFTNNEVGEKIIFNSFTNTEDEAKSIVSEVTTLLNDGYKLNEIAVLYRTNAQSRAVVDELILNDISHVVYSNEGFYDRSEVRDIISYIKVLNNRYEADLYDFKRIINKPSRFLGAKFITEIENVQLENGLDSFWEALENLESADLKYYQKKSGQVFVNDILNACKVITERKHDLKQIVNYILYDLGYLNWLMKGDNDCENEPDNDIKMNVDSLLTGLNRHDTVEDFLDYIDSLRNIETDIDKDYMHLMTIHKSKGMEFPVVFVIGMTEGIMPHKRSDSEEEERRIAYVAITRSKKLLYISSIHNVADQKKQVVSKFVREIGLINDINEEIGESESKVVKKKVILRKKNVNDQIKVINKILGKK